MSFHLMLGFEMSLLLHAWWSEFKQRCSVSRPIIHQPFQSNHCENNNNINTNPNINSLNIAFICLVRAQQKYSHSNHGQCSWFGKIYAQRGREGERVRREKSGVDPEFIFFSLPDSPSTLFKTVYFIPHQIFPFFVLRCYRCWVLVCVHAISVVWCICKWVLNWLQIDEKCV